METLPIIDMSALFDRGDASRQPVTDFMLGQEVSP